MEINDEVDAEKKKHATDYKKELQHIVRERKPDEVAMTSHRNNFYPSARKSCRRGRKHERLC